uniref:Galactosylgalactosylxylosylprotein 3-beta-glucuronosyltransferase n=1 Tax=Megaselia scalaris TaxID=36166 RepID=T1H0C7_MEGSC
MAGFAVNLEYLFKHKDEVTMPYKAGYEEDKFLKSLKLRLEDVEPKARNCTEILVYHTQTKKTKSPDINFSPIHQLSSPSTSNIGHLFRFMESAGISHFTSSKG